MIAEFLTVCIYWCGVCVAAVFAVLIPAAVFVWLRELLWNRDRRVHVRECRLREPTLTAARVDAVPADLLESEADAFVVALEEIRRLRFFNQQEWVA